MIDLILAQRWHLEIDEGFMSPDKIEGLLGDLGDPDLRESVKVRAVCTADFQNEVLIGEGRADIVIDLTTLETAFSFASGFLNRAEAERDPTKLTLLRMMATLALPFGDEVLSAGFLSEYITERARIEAAWQPHGLRLDEDARDDLMAKDAIAAFITGHEAGHFLYKTSPEFRDEMIERVRHTVSNALAALGGEALQADGRRFLEGVIGAIDDDPLNGSRANDVEELACDFAAGEAALNAMTNSVEDTEDLRTVFAAIQAAVATNWVIEAARDAFQYVVLAMPSGRAHRNELLAGRSLVTAINLAAHRYKGIEGYNAPDDDAINRVLGDIPDSDEKLVRTFNGLWSQPAQLQREYLGAIHTNFGGLTGPPLIKSAEAILRQSAGNRAER